MRTMSGHKMGLRLSASALAWACLVLPCAWAAGNIDPTNKNAWTENAGWANASPTNGGVTVYFDGTNGYLTGLAWGENIGWIKLGDNTGGPYNNTSATDWGVNLTSSNLSGYAWGENVGWIKFNSAYHQATIEMATGRFNGYAWGETIGWVRFKGTAPDYNVRTLAILTVNGPAAITAQPVSLTTNAGGSASFTVGASGTAPLFYQWQKNTTNINLATNAIYMIGSIAASDAGNYRCLVSNVMNAVTSAVATLTVTVNTPAAITVQPVSLTTNVGGSASFTVGASGTAPLYYQWQKNSTNINLATSATYTINPVALGNAGNYRCIVSNMVNAATSAVATLTVNGPATITTQPQSLTNNLGSAANFTVAASGTAPLFYQWQKNSTNIGSATSATYTIAPVAAGDAGNYRCIVSNVVNAATSAVATLTVTAIPGEIGVFDSIPPNSDTNMPFGPVIVGLSRTEHVTISNTNATHSLLISNISFAMYQEDFDDRLAQWWVETTDPQWQVVSGEYRAQAGSSQISMQSTYVGDRWQDCHAQATMHSTGDPNSSAGIAVRASDDFIYDNKSAGSAYCVGVDGDGFYWVGKYVAGSFSSLQSWTTSPYLNTGTATNIVAINVLGAAITVYFNGNLAWSGADTSITNAGHVALFGDSGYFSEAVHYFDNVAVVDLEDTAINLAGTSRGPFTLTNLPAFPYSLAAGSNLTFDVIYAPEAIGSDDAAVVIESDDADEPRVEVALSGEGIQDYLAVTPASGFEASGHPGGPFAPSNMVYGVSNAGPVTIQWAAWSTQAWVTVMPVGGTLNSGASASMTVSVNVAAAALGQGVYGDTVLFSNLTTTIAEQRRGVRLEVFTTPRITVTPASLTVTNALGGSSQRLLTISNAAGADGNLSFQLYSTRETGSGMVGMVGLGVGMAVGVGQGVGLPPPGRDFTKAAPGVEFRPGRLLVRFASGMKKSARAGLLAQVDSAAAVEREYTIVPGLCRVKMGAGQTMADALRVWNRTPGVLYAEPDYKVQMVKIPDDTRFGD
ncbi:MAG: immunoglobulin domain-containing protein, partial [Verrucomicrobia bacterium]|nr:immunoglobulin domain-containing protein [Verrucomicrobiota bacterium]